MPTGAGSGLPGRVPPVPQVQCTLPIDMIDVISMIDMVTS
jgi:hypothetical protein